MKPNFWVQVLGAAGLLPLVAVLVVVLGDFSLGLKAAALLIGFGYAALILSFLGGLWWGLAAAAEGRAPRWLWAAAVVPSLWAFFVGVPMALGRLEPQAGLVVVGVGLVAALLVDRALAARRLAPVWWMGLRVPLSLGLGGMSVVVGVFG